ncbi:hypothetical protein [Sorangium sp. So ce128]|uniref:hypothetical protein n=1 Tax=Sorangium sp. So ce128 TaxID=3133281 RepID=UPI003F5E2032
MDQPVPGDSRAQQADVAGALADRAFDALGVLLRGFEDAAERDGAGVLEDALARGPEHLHGGLLTAILRLVFLLHAEDRGLLPASDPYYAAHLGVRLLCQELAERGARPGALRWLPLGGGGSDFRRPWELHRCAAVCFCGDP